MNSYSGRVSQSSATIEQYYMYFVQWSYLSTITSNGCATFACTSMSHYNVPKYQDAPLSIHVGRSMLSYHVHIHNIHQYFPLKHIIQCASVYCIYHTRCALASHFDPIFASAIPLYRRRTLFVQPLSLLCLTLPCPAELWDEDGNYRYCFVQYTTLGEIDNWHSIESGGKKLCRVEVGFVTCVTIQTNKRSWSDWTHRSV